MENIFTDKLGVDRILAICKEYNIKNNEVRKVRIALSMFAGFGKFSGEEDFSNEDIAVIVAARINDKDFRIVSACSDIIIESSIAYELDDDDWYDPTMAN